MSSGGVHNCKLIERFSVKERFFMRSGWLGFMAVGCYGIYTQDPLWALLYIVFGLLGFALVVLPALCSRCPYPVEFSTCLFLPPSLIRRFYPYRGPHMSLSGKISTIVILVGVVAFPLYWLADNRLLLLVYWIFGLPALAAFPLHYCRRCRHSGCPLNKASASNTGMPY
jgi:hypothetical protein